MSSSSKGRYPPCEFISIWLNLVRSLMSYFRLSMEVSLAILITLARVVVSLCKFYFLGFLSKMVILDQSNIIDIVYHLEHVIIVGPLVNSQESIPGMGR